MKKNKGQSRQMIGKIRYEQKQENANSQLQRFENNNRDKIYLVRIIWDEIYFEKDKIRFRSDRFKSMLYPMTVQGVFPELNDIKKEYFNKNYGNKLYKLRFFNSVLQVEESPDWNKILQTIEIGKGYYKFEVAKTPKRIIARSAIKFNPAISKTQFIDKYNQELNRNEFLRFLAGIHFKEFPVIPIIEATKNSSEHSFLFRVRTKDKSILIIWENVNIGRATHLFKCSEFELAIGMREIESFICTSMTWKRALLYLKDYKNLKLKSKLGYFETIKHTNIDMYRESIYNSYKYN